MFQRGRNLIGSHTGYWCTDEWARRDFFLFFGGGGGGGVIGPFMWNYAKDHQLTNFLAYAGAMDTMTEIGVLSTPSTSVDI